MTSVANGINTGFKAVEKVGKTAGTVMKTGLKVFAAASTAAVGFGGSAVNAGMNFDAAMSQVAAVSGATGDSFDALRKKAIEMGATTQFSASEAAEAMNYMAMAGWKDQDMLSGIKGIMDLAAASGEDLATTSDIVTDALTAFGMTAGDSGRFADILAVASSNANTNVGMMGDTFKYVAPIAGAMGYSAEDTAVAIGLMANSGIKATQAGTSLRSIMTRLAKPTKESQMAMDALGLSITNSDGSMKSLNEIVADMREGFSGLTESQKASYAAMLGGQEAMSGLLAIVNASESDVQKLTDAINDCNGAAEKMAGTMIDNLAGDVKLLKSAFESLQITISDALTPMLRDFAQFGTKAMEQLTMGFQEGGTSGFFSALTDVVSQAVTTLAQRAPEFVSVSLQFITALGEGLINAAPEILSAAEEVVTMLVGSIYYASENHNNDILKIGKSIIELVSEGFKDAGEAIGYAIESLIPLIADAFLSYHEALFTVGMDILGAIGEGIVKNKDQIQEMASETIANMVTALSENAPDIIEGGIALLEALVGAIEENLPLIVEAGAAIIGELISGISTASPGVQAIIATAVIPHILKIMDTVKGIGTAVSSMASVIKPVISGIGTVVSGSVTKILSIVSKVSTALKALWALMLANPVTIVIAAVAALVAAFVLLWNKCEGFRDFWLGLWDKLKEAFSAFGDWIGEKIDSIKEFFGSLRESIEEKFGAIGDWFREKFTEAMDAVKSAWEGAKEFFSGIYEGIKEVFSAVGEWFGEKFSAAMEAVKNAWNGAKEFFSGIWDGIKEVFSTVKEWFGEKFSAAWEAAKGAWDTAKEFFGDLWDNIKEKAGDAADNIETKLKDAWDGIKTAWDAAKEFFGDIFGSIMDKGRETAEKVGDKLAAAYNYVKEHWDEATPYFDGLWGNIKNVFGDAWDAFKSVGSNMLAGLWNGIKDKIAWLKGKVNGVVDTIKGWFVGKDGFDEHSPSKWSNKVFRYVMEGGGKGLEAGLPSLMRNVNSVVNRVKNGMDFDTAKIGVSGGSLNHGSSAIAGSRGGDTYNFYSPKALDPVSAAREMRKAKQQMALGYVGG